MTEEEIAARASMDEAVLQQQYLRSLSSFEGIVLSQIDLKNTLGDRLNWSIRAGLVILSGIAISILILLWTLSSQVNKMSAVVANMNLHFTSVASQMDQIALHTRRMESQVALLPDIDGYLKVMDTEMSSIKGDMVEIRDIVGEMRKEFDMVRIDIQDVDATMIEMTRQVQAMGAEMHHMAEPARTMNKFVPFP